MISGRQRVPRHPPCPSGPAPRGERLQTDQWRRGIGLGHKEPGHSNRCCPKLRGFAYLANVVEGVKFVNGKEIEQPDQVAT